MKWPRKLFVYLTAPPMNEVWNFLADECCRTCLLFTSRSCPQILEGSEQTWQRNYIYKHMSLPCVLLNPIFCWKVCMLWNKYFRVSNNNVCKTAGCGGFINLYDFDSNELLESLDIFRGSRIHGIQYSPQNRTAIVFGGKLLALVAFNDSGTASPRLVFTLNVI